MTNMTKRNTRKVASSVALHTLFIIIGAYACAMTSACSGRASQAEADSLAQRDSDSIQLAREAEALERELAMLPATPQPSVEGITYSITVMDTATDGTVRYEDQLMWDGSVKRRATMYDGQDGWFTFRGSLRRDAPFGGTVKGEPKEVVKVWTFQTMYDGTQTSMGTWGGGSGWTGEPVYVRWPEQRMAQFDRQAAQLTDDFGQEEVIVGSLCGKVYFINWQTGKASRQPIEVVNPIKGSVSLDPSLNGNLYVGQGIPKVPPMSQLCLDINQHRQTFASGSDHNAWVRWGAYDSSPVRVGRFLFWPGENGTLYKYLILNEGKGLRLHSTLRCKANRQAAAGTENSLCVYRNYGFYGNNHGDIICFELSTLQPIWHYDNHDDIDASIVCEVEDETPYIYCGCEVDQQGNAGTSHLVKLNALNGQPVWDTALPCQKLNLGGKHFDGGFYSTPLLGQADCDSLLFASVCQPKGCNVAEFTAFSRRDGHVVYRQRLKQFAWSSPVGFVSDNGRFYIFAGDSSGNAYLFEGSTGRLIFTQHMCNNFESSPVVVGNQFVVGSRGQEIHKYEVR